MAGRIEEYKTDQIIINEGDKNDRMFVVLEGAVVLYMNYKKSNEYVLGVRGKGKIFGDMSMLTGEDNMYTAVAFSDAKLVWFQLNNLEEFMYEYRGYAVDFLKKIAKNNSVLRRNFSMLLEELDQLNGNKISKEDIKKEATKMGTIEVPDYNTEYGYKARFMDK